MTSLGTYMGPDTGRASLHRGVKKGPGHHADNQVQIKFFYVDPENDRKDHGINNNLAQGIDIGPQEAQYGPFVTAS